MQSSEERQELLRLARAGDKDALGALLGSYRPYLRVIMYRLWPCSLQARADGSDLTQDAVVEAVRSFSGFQGTSLEELLAWLRTLIHRTVRRMRRQLDAGKRDPARERLIDDLHHPLANSSGSPVARVISHEEELRLAEALDQLPEDDQKVLFARHFEGLTYEQLAELLGKSEVAVRVQCSRALQKLRDLLKE